MQLFSKTAARLSLTFAMPALILCLISISAQAQTVEQNPAKSSEPEKPSKAVTQSQPPPKIEIGPEKPDGSRVILIHGIPYRAFPETALRQLAEQKVELDSARSEITNLKQQLEKSTNIEAALKSQIDLSLKNQALLEKQIAKLTETVAGLDANNKKLDTLTKEATASPGFWNSWKGKLTLSAIQIGASFAIDRLSSHRAQ